MKTTLLALLAVSACTSAPDPYMKGFSPKAPQPGYTRYIAPVVHDIQPGDDTEYCQWLEAPATTDRQIIDMLGQQSLGGHHIALYASDINEAVGTTRICTTQDMVSIAFIGGAGGEGGMSATNLPEGYAFSLPAGKALMANTHYLNATDGVFDAQSVADIKFADPKNPLAPVGMYVVNWDQFTVPAGQAYTGNAYCTADRTLNVLKWTNHMHEWGQSALSEVIHPDGTKTMLVQDTTWAPERAFNPVWANWDPAQPLVINPGDKLHVQCSWANTTNADLIFPREMCDGVSLVLEDIPQTVCEATAN